MLFFCLFFGELPYDISSNPTVKLISIYKSLLPPNYHRLLLYQLSDDISFIFPIVIPRKQKSTHNSNHSTDGQHFRQSNVNLLITSLIFIILSLTVNSTLNTLSFEIFVSTLLGSSWYVQLFRSSVGRKDKENTD